MKKNSLSLLAIVLLTGLLAVSCGSNKDSDNSKGNPADDDGSFNRSESMSYTYTLNGCSTGEQEFDSKRALCYGLQDSKLNKGCAESMRAQAFKDQQCAGEFKPF